MNTLSGSAVTAWERVRERSERGCGSCFALLHTSQKSLAQQLYSFCRPDSSSESGFLAHTPPLHYPDFRQRCAGGGERFVGRLLIPPKNDWCNACGNASVIARELATVAISQFLPTTPLFKLKDPLPSASSGDFAPQSPYSFSLRFKDLRPTLRWRGLW